MEAMERICPFCELEGRVLKENKHAVVILSNPRKVPGHFLVLPKRHVEKPWELSAEELQGIFELIFFTEQRILGHLGDGADIRQNYRPFKKHSTNFAANHILFHVIPRSADDYIYSISEKFEKDLFADLDSLEATEVAKLLA
ncbi:MAG: HIT domain-containing protein [Candidatus Saccharimonadales bacterium]